MVSLPWGKTMFDFLHHLSEVNLITDIFALERLNIAKSFLSSL